MSRTLTWALMVLGLLSCTRFVPGQTRYFPERTFGDDSQSDRFVSAWYSRQLRALHEPSLLESSKLPSAVSYRFLWLRTFHHPVAVRVDVQSDGRAILTTKITSGAGGYSAGDLITNETKTLGNEEADRIIAKIDASGFWKMPAYSREQAGADGSEWVMEAVVNGKYHLVSEWTPTKGAIHDLGTFFLFDLAKIEIPGREMY